MRALLVAVLVLTLAPAAQAADWMSTASGQHAAQVVVAHWAHTDDASGYTVTNCRHIAHNAIICDADEANPAAFGPTWAADSDYNYAVFLGRHHAIVRAHTTMFPAVVDVAF